MKTILILLLVYVAYNHTSIAHKLDQVYVIKEQNGYFVSTHGKPIVATCYTVENR